MTTPSAESALIIAVPEAEPLVKSFRERFDPSAAVGVPAHITILYPFKPPHEITPAERPDPRYDSRHNVALWDRRSRGVTVS